MICKRELRFYLALAKSIYYDTFPYEQANAANSGDSNATKVIKIFPVFKSLNPLKKWI